MAGQWDPTSLPVRPGLYINFVDAAIEQISGGPRGIVAMPIEDYDGDAEEEKFYTFESPARVDEKLGEDSDGAKYAKWALRNASKVIVYTLPTEPVVSEVLEEFETRIFNVFVWSEKTDQEDQDEIKAWTNKNKEEGFHFMTVFGGTKEDDQEPETGNDRSTSFSNDYVVNLITGVEYAGEEYSSAEYAPYIAGLIAGNRINQSITYDQVLADDVTKRLRNAQIKDALESGSLVLVHDGDKVKVESGITTSKEKIRPIRARQAIATDIEKTAADSYIGKLDNNPDGQAALKSAITAYLERMENNNVLLDPEVKLDPDRPPEGDKVFIIVEYTEVDSMERIFLNIRV